MQNGSYFCVFKYARAVKQNALNKAENSERDWGDTHTPHARRACEARALRSRKTLRLCFTDFFTDFENKKKKTDCFAVYGVSSVVELPSTVGKRLQAVETFKRKLKEHLLLRAYMEH